jgi:excisionase family DNA binding protein
MFMTDDRWLSVEEIAEHLGDTKDSIYRWIEKRRLPAHKLGKLWKFKKDEVDAWVTVIKQLVSPGFFVRAFIPKDHPGNAGYVHPISENRFVMPSPIMCTRVCASTGADDSKYRITQMNERTAAHPTVLPAHDSWPFFSPQFTRLLNRHPSACYESR